MASLAPQIGHRPGSVVGSAAQEWGFADSTFLQAIKYDPSSFQLTITMKNGAQYSHLYVFPITVEQFLQAPSKGRFYSEMIKGKFPSVKVIHKNVGAPERSALKGSFDERKRRHEQRFRGRAGA